MVYFLSTKKLHFKTIVVFCRTFTFIEQSFIDLNLLFWIVNGGEEGQVKVKVKVKAATEYLPSPAAVPLIPGLWHQRW